MDYYEYIRYKQEAFGIIEMRNNTEMIVKLDNAGCEKLDKMQISYENLKTKIPASLIRSRMQIIIYNPKREAFEKYNYSNTRIGTLDGWIYYSDICENDNVDNIPYCLNYFNT